jgi:predicted AlkP superfamily phosphohydrolase/phosphomutase
MQDSEYVGFAVGSKTGAFGDNSVFAPPSIGSAAHSINGLFILCGPSFKKTENKKADIMDITPTILSLLNASIPSDIDGRIIQG